MKARVLQSTGGWYKLETEEGEFLDGRLRGKMRLSGPDVTNPVAVGDFVYIDIEEDGAATINEVGERKNAILREATRAGKRGKRQIIAANIDRALAVQSAAKPYPKPAFIDRFLVTCEAYDVPPAVVFNKTDLARGNKQENLDHLTEIYQTLDYPVLHTSIHDEESLQSFSGFIRDQLVVMVGHSGVGKSSLINAIEPGLQLKTADVSKSSQKGKHTTTFAQLHRLSNGALLVDTPGIREFGLADFEPEELSLFFPEMREAREHCSFNDCTHIHEPGCHVLQLLEEGEIYRQRYHSYMNMMESLQNESW